MAIRDNLKRIIVLLALVLAVAFIEAAYITTAGDIAHPSAASTYQEGLDMNYSNSQGASVTPPAEPGSEQGYGLDKRITGIDAFPAFK